MYYLEYLNLNQYATATAQPGLSVKKIEKVSVKCPPYSEQKVIAAQLNTMLTSNDYTKQYADEVLDSIDTMKKSILARAFRGELGTNDPAEEIVKVV